MRLTGPLLSAFSDPAEYEDFIRRIGCAFKKIKERNEKTIDFAEQKTLKNY